MQPGSVDIAPKEKEIVRSGFLPDRTIHLHPTRLCNLQCLHCYSTSGTQYKSALDPASIGRALALLRTEGYETISLSGGEPLVYRPLHDVILMAKDLGYRVTMITNGLLATERNDPTLDLLDGMAISFDGLAGTHDRMRARQGAFALASRSLERLAARGRSVACAISVTRETIPELPELAEHLVGLGARALQIRPVAPAGRARTMEGLVPFSEADRSRLYLVALALGEALAGTAHISCDLAPAWGLWHQRDAYAGLLSNCADVPIYERPLADLVNPLVITDEGILKPGTYDFAPRYDVAHLENLDQHTLVHYKSSDIEVWQQLVAGVLTDCGSRKDLVDWFDLCAQASELDRDKSPDPLQATPIYEGTLRNGTTQGSLLETIQPSNPSR